MKHAYYNEIEPQKAAWLRELIVRNLIAPGDVDERSIRDVRADDLRGYAQCHFFAGIGTWSYALRLARWPDDREVWTGSCPCQPFSAAGKHEAFNDERHLWPAWFSLLAARRPLVCFGEQVSSIDGLAWFDIVRTDLDDAGYTCGVLDTCAAGVGAPHRRQRLYFVASNDRASRRAPSAGVVSGLSPSVAMEMETTREGIRLPHHSAGQSVPTSPDFGIGSERSRSGGSHQSKQVGLPTRKPSTGDYLGEQSEQEIICRGSEETQREKSVGGESSDQRKEGLPRNFYHLRSGNGSQDKVLERAKRGDSPELADAATVGHHGGRPSQTERRPSESQRFRDADLVADSHDAGLEERGRKPAKPRQECAAAERTGDAQFLADSIGDGAQRAGSEEQIVAAGRTAVGLADADDERWEGERLHLHAGQSPESVSETSGRGAVNGFWQNAHWVLTRPQRVGDRPGLRPVEPGAFPLAHGTSARVGRLRGYGDSIVAPVAQAFIKAYLDFDEENH